MDPEAAQLARRRQRNVLLLTARNELATATQIMNPEIDFDAQKSQVSLKKLTYYQAKLSKLDTDILMNIIDEEEATVECQGASEFDEELLGTISLLSTRVEIDQKPHVGSFHSLSNSQTSLAGNKIAPVKLPKLELAKFHGDPLKWAEFWDSYSSTIHNNDDLSDVDKFKYLKGFLDGDALSVIGGYMLTSANYQTAVEALCDRFGNKQLAIFAHFEALLSLPIATHEIKKLQHVYDECEKHIRSLVALGLGEETFGQVFTPIILSKLPLYVKMELHRKNGSDPWDLSKLRGWLREEIRARDYSQRVFATAASGQQNQDSGSGDQKSKRGQSSFNQRSNSKPMGTTSALVTNDTQKTPRCCLCNESHFADQCQKYPTAEARKEQLVQANRCFKCLSNKHPAKDCPTTRACVHCRKTGHHRCICRLKFSSQTGQSATSNKNVAMTVGDSSMGSTVPNTDQLIAHGERAILQTALANMKSNNGRLVQARILFDTGCSRSFITTDLSKKIQTVPQSDEVVAIAGFGDNVRKTVKYKTVEMEICLPSGGSKKMTANVTSTISCPVQKLPLSVEKNPILAQLKLADPPVSSPEMVTVDILVGTDYYYDFIGSEQLRLSNGIILLSSALGYIATGKVQWDSNFSEKRSVLFASQEQELAGSTFNVEKFWRLEDIGVKEVAPTNDDEDAVTSFNKSVKFINGRYHVNWPWKRDEKELPDNYHLALGRLKSLKKKLDTTPEVLSTYNKTIQDQLEKGIIEKVPEGNTSNKVHYIPHHCVITPTKTTTKLRVVYDASAKTSKHSPSINECLNRGPVLLDNLCGLILKFRCHTIGMVSDIEKAFLQVGLHDESRDVTRFLWLKDPNGGVTQENLVQFRFCRVAFGYNSSPFLLAATVYHHVENSKRPAAADVKGNMYVDNLVNGKETVQESKEFYLDAKGLFKDASMNLREWFTNNDDLRDTFAPEDRGKETVTKVLGLSWNTADDTLSTSTFSIQKDSVTTKRQMLSNLAKVFDPCGYYSPLTITGKMLIQKLWKGDHGWDDALPNEVVQEWNNCAADLMKISEHAISRRLFSKPIHADTQLDLHCFSDASGKAYGACIYLVRHDASGSESALVFAKSRVAPVKELTIPRLELMAVLIGVRSIAFVTEQLKLPIRKTTLWSDSQCVLHWLSKTSVATRFVKNRIDEIKEHRTTSFRYVPTEVNPADLISRGCSYQHITESDLWWRGPDWIVKNSSEWPANIVLSKRITTTTDSVAQEQPMALPVNDSAKEILEPLITVSRYSSLLRLIRVTAWVFRFVRNLRQKTAPQKNCLQSSELAEALKYWELSTQKTFFHSVIHTMETKTRMPIVQQLNLVLDNDGLIRCNKRLDHAAITEDAKRPILLPKKSNFTRLVIRNCHDRQYHAGVSQTLANTRLKYHIVHGRSQVKGVISRCRLCRFMYGGPFKYPQSPSLPKFRVDAQRPFQFTGIDYMGPLYIKDSTHCKQKVWICLFTCAAIRAVHLEVVTDLSAQQFLLCLRRFVSQCDKPQLIVSDNAKQFQASEKFLSEVLPSPQVQDFAASEGIQWKFVTERSPWMGGFYERMVGIVKKALKTSLDRRCVTLVELQTVAAEVCSVVNSRPLTYVGSDDTPLTPSHFVKGVCLRASSSDVSTQDCPRNVTHASLNSLWKRTQVLLNSFWKQWQTQYLHSLRANFKFKDHNTSSLQPLVGSVVIVKDDLPRASWRLGKIVELVNSQDGKVRTAVIQLPNRRRIKRAIRLLFPLEIPLQMSEQSNNNSQIQPTQTVSDDDDNVSTASVELLLNEDRQDDC